MFIFRNHFTLLKDQKRGFIDIGFFEWVFMRAEGSSRDKWDEKIHKKKIQKLIFLDYFENFNF